VAGYAATTATPGCAASGSSAAIVTLADVLRRLEVDQSLDPQRKRELQSAVRTLSRALRADPHLIPAEPRYLRPKLSKLTPAMAGVSPPRWSNAKSLLLKALKRVGLRSMAGRSREPLAPKWDVLRAHLPDRHFQSGLSRFMSYCTALMIEPAQVTAETFVEFGKELQTNSLTRDPGSIYRDTCKLWNLAAKTISEWPQLLVSVPDRRRNFAFALDAFPQSFRADVERFLSKGGEPDVFSDSYHKPLTELTLRNWRQYIAMAATALIHCGVPIEQITGLNVLVDITNAKSLLQFLYKRAQDETNHQIYHVATLLKTIAQHDAKQPSKTIDKLRKFCKGLKPETERFTQKNRDCLRQFADHKRLEALLSLPQRVLTEVGKLHSLRRGDAVRVELATATAVLLNIPIRIRNLTGLQPDRHLQTFGDRTFLSISSDETKNRVPINAELSVRSAGQLEIYVRQHRPLLLDTASNWLFPGENGRQRQPGSFGQQITAFVAKEAGVVITPHQFRHLAAKLYLDEHPNGFEIVRQLLGHKSIETTMRYYRELEAALASKRYAAVLEKLRAE
jgi:integrase